MQQASGSNERPTWDIFCSGQRPVPPVWAGFCSKEALLLTASWKDSTCLRKAAWRCGELTRQLWRAGWTPDSRDSMQVLQVAGPGRTRRENHQSATSPERGCSQHIAALELHEAPTNNGYKVSTVTRRHVSHAGHIRNLIRHWKDYESIQTL